MKKIMFAAVVAMFAVSAHAGKKADMVEVPNSSKDTCTTPNTWKNDKCWAKAETASTTTTTTTAPTEAVKTK